MSQIAYRLARLDDAIAIAEVHVETWKTAYRDLLPDAMLASLIPADRYDRWRRAIEAEDCITVVATIDDRVVGFVSSRPWSEDPETTAELDALYILESQAGLGIGTALMQWSDTWMSDRGFQRAILWVLPTNVSARRFYEAKGWSVDPGSEKVLTRPGGDVPAIRYSKRIIHSNS